MTIKIKIQSASDVITNSSTEIYTVWNSENIKKTIIDMVNSLLSLGQSDLTFNDLFTIEIKWEDEDDFSRHGFSTKEEWVNALEESGGFYDDWGYNNYYQVTAKPGAEKFLGADKIAELINQIGSAFGSDYFAN